LILGDEGAAGTTASSSVVRFPSKREIDSVCDLFPGRREQILLLLNALSPTVVKTLSNTLSTIFFYCLHHHSNSMGFIGGPSSSTDTRIRYVVVVVAPRKNI